MLFVLFSTPLSLLCAYLTYLTWRSHRPVALTMGAFSLVFFLVAVVSGYVTYFCAQVLMNAPTY